MSEFMQSLLTSIGQTKNAELHADPLAAFATVAKHAKHVAKTPVEQEFPGLMGISLAPHFMTPSLMFYHEPTGYLIYGGMTLMPCVSPVGKDWMSVPIVIRYAATQRFSEQLAIAAIQATYLQTVELPKFKAEQISAEEWRHTLRLDFGDAKDGGVQEIAPGVFETYAILSMDAGKPVVEESVATMKALVRRFED